MTDQFRYFATPATAPITVRLPDTGHKDSTRLVIRELRLQTGLTFPSDTDVFWINSRRCLLTRRRTGEPLGELIYEA